MTNDYKNLLLKYLTGNIIEGSQSTTPFYETFDYTRGTNDDWVSLGTKTVKCKDGKGNYNGKTICLSSNILTLVDEDRNVLAVYTEFSSGTPLNNILDINVDEEGRFYAIDKDTDTNKYRFLLLNNLSEKTKTINGMEYKCVLRNSYFIQGYEGATIYWSYGARLTKSKSNATYYFAMFTDNGFEPSTLQINVGEANVWAKLETIPFIYSDGGLLDSYVYFNSSDTPMAYYYFYKNVTVNGNYDREITKISAIGDGNPTEETLWASINTLFGATNRNHYTINAKAIKENECYLILSGAVVDGGSYRQQIKVYRFGLGFIQTFLDQQSTITISNANIMYVNYDVVNNALYLLYQFQESDNDPTYKQHLWFILVDPQNNVNYKLDTERLVPSGTNQPMILADTFDLKQVIYEYQDDDEIETDIIKLMFNPLNYMGEAYEGGVSLVPKEGLLYNADNELIFARQLYNTKVYNNRTISTLNVPYNYLNSGTIKKIGILGWLNSELIESSLTVQKNIYEDLYINYFNTLTMENRNTNDYIVNLPGAIRLNKCGSYRENEYGVGSCTKIKINYDDNTSLISSTMAIINNGVATYKNLIYVPSNKNIVSIDYISEDENTIYNTMTGLNLESNKYYNITQDVHVE